MSERRWCARVSGVFLLSAGMGLQGFQPIGASAQESLPALVGPSAGGAVPMPPEPGLRGVAGELRHEAWLDNGSEAARVRAPKAPPAPLVERPAGDPTGPGAVWIPGYWMWEPSRQDFDWVSGAWKVPPRDQIWAGGRWQRDARGWARVPGVWTPRQAAAIARADWRKAGPPTDPPADEPGPAPGADAFYVPGHHTPDGDRVTWTPGYWAHMRPGFDWIPARWVRRPEGWDYRAGYWASDSAPVRHDVARPLLESDGLPPAIVDSVPADPRNDDPIAATETAPRIPDVSVTMPPVVVVPGPVVVRAPYRYIGPYRRPTYYDPLNVTPPFVRRFLDRVMP